MKCKQYCSVCKQWLDMEVVSNGDDEEDDGVTWFRCPGCQGFLPKLTSETDGEMEGESPAQAPEDPAPATVDSPAEPADPELDEGMPGSSPDEWLAGTEFTSLAEVTETPELIEADGDSPEDSVASEPLAEYAAMLAEMDPEKSEPYRPWNSYRIGQCVLHLAWDDCGVVVGKESLPGGRQVIKCFFSETGIVRLIENAPR